MADNAMRLLAVIVDHGKGEDVAMFHKDNDVAYSFLIHGQGTVRSEMMQLLGLGTIDKDVVLALLPKHKVKTHLAGLSGLLTLKRPGKGIAFTIPLMALNALVSQSIQSALPVDDEEKEVKHMPPKFCLIYVIVESGFVDQAMEEARKAGATGGTLLQARGVGNDESETFLGAALTSEKALLMIIAECMASRDIMESINKTCGLLTEAKGIVFSLPVEDIAGIM